MHAFEESALNVSGHARTGDEDKLTGQGGPAGRPCFVAEDSFDYLFIDGENSIHGHDGDMQDGRHRDQAGLIFVMDEAQRSGFSDGKIGSGNSCLGLVKDGIPIRVRSGKSRGVITWMSFFLPHDGRSSFETTSSVVAMTFFNPSPLATSASFPRAS